MLAFATWRLSGLDLNTSDNTIRGVLFLRGLRDGHGDDAGHGGLDGHDPART